MSPRTPTEQIFHLLKDLSRPDARLRLLGLGHNLRLYRRLSISHRPAKRSTPPKDGGGSRDSSSPYHRTLGWTAHIQPRPQKPLKERPRDTNSNTLVNNISREWS